MKKLTSHYKNVLMKYVLICMTVAMIGFEAKAMYIYSDNYLFNAMSLYHTKYLEVVNDFTTSTHYQVRNEIEFIGYGGQYIITGKPGQQWLAFFEIEEGASARISNLIFEKMDRVFTTNTSRFVDIDKVIFRDNSNNGSGGGAIWNGNSLNAALSIRNTIFSNNSSNSGGAIYNFGRVYLQGGNTFEQNKNFAISNQSGGDIRFDGINTFRNNSGAIENRGMVNVISGLLDFQNTTDTVNNSGKFLVHANVNFKGVSNTGILEIAGGTTQFKGVLSNNNELRIYGENVSFYNNVEGNGLFKISGGTTTLEEGVKFQQRILEIVSGNFVVKNNGSFSVNEVKNSGSFFVDSGDLNFNSGLSGEGTLTVGREADTGTVSFTSGTNFSQKKLEVLGGTFVVNDANKFSISDAITLDKTGVLQIKSGNFNSVVKKGNNVSTAKVLIDTGDSVTFGTKTTVETKIENNGTVIYATSSAQLLNNLEGSGELKIGTSSLDTTLKVGKDIGITQNKLSIVNGTLDLSNGTINTYNINNVDFGSNATLRIDATLSAGAIGSSDKIVLTGTATGTLNILPVLSNDLDKGCVSTLQIFVGGDATSLTINQKNISTAAGIYEVKQGGDKHQVIVSRTNDSTYTLKQHIAAETGLLKINDFVILKDSPLEVNEDLGTLTRYSGEASRSFNLFGNSNPYKELSVLKTSTGKKGITVNNGDILTIEKLNVDGFSFAVQNAGVLGISQSIFNSNEIDIINNGATAVYGQGGEDDFVTLNKGMKGNGKTIVYGGALYLADGAKFEQNSLNVYENGALSVNVNDALKIKTGFIENSGYVELRGTGTLQNVYKNSGDSYGILAIQSGATINIDTDQENIVYVEGDGRLNWYGGSIDYLAYEGTTADTMDGYKRSIEVLGPVHLGVEALSLSSNAVLNLPSEAMLSVSSGVFISSLRAYGGSVFMQNDEVSSLLVDNLILAKDLNLFVDADLQGVIMDTINPASTDKITFAGAGAINVYDINLISYTLDDVTKISFATEDFKDRVSYLGDIVSYQGYSYAVEYDKTTGQFIFKREYPPVATTDEYQDHAQSANAILGTTQDMITNIASVVQNRMSGDMRKYGEIEVEQLGQSGGDCIQYGVWGQVLYNDTNRKGRKTAFKSETAGFALGFDSLISDNMMLGIAYAHADGDTKAHNVKSKSKTNSFYIYGQYTKEKLFANASIGYGITDTDVKDSYKTNIDSDFWNANATIGYKIKKFAPAVGLRVLRVKQDGYKTGPDEFKDRTVYTETAVASVTWSDEFKFSRKYFLRPMASFGLTYDFRTDSNKVVVNSSRAPTALVLESKRLSRLGAEIKFGAELDIGDNLSVSLDYQGNFTKGYRSHTGIFSGKYNF
ncbi:MAG: autotransporter domain-containing protein [Alphaproteobacteria bacterium]|nr:autotransporter domain-containing protein [Alphaproteobacteria bacterium]